MTLRGVVNAVVLAWGTKRAAIATAAGALSTLAMTPFDVWPVMFVTLPVAVWLIDGAAGGRGGGVMAAGVAGWFFGFGYFVTGFYWIGSAFLVDAKTFGWLMPLAVVGLPAAMAIYVGLSFALARLLWTRGMSRILILAAALTASEWLRGHLFTGFPWNTLGYALSGWLPLAQSSSLIGLWGMTFLAVAIFAAPAALADDLKDTPRPWTAPVLALATLAAMAAFGAIRLYETPTTIVEGVRLRIMQPNLQQDQKFNYGAKDQIMARYLALSDRATGPQSSGVRDATHLIWPESAFPFFLTREPDALAQISQFLPEGTVLITGAARAAEITENPRRIRAYNSVYVLDHDGSILSIYDKMHLVPFGEYLPFQSVLEKLGFQQLTKQQGGFEAGTRRRALATPKAPPFFPLICYEVIFPGEAVPRGEPGEWMLNLTNDAWFGITAGPYQHFQQARVRAIEEGLPLVRAANNGISGVVDPVGRVLSTLPLGVEGVLDSALPRPSSPTVYSRWRDWPAATVVAAVLLLAGVRRLRR